MTNRLVHSQSLYLRKHAENPIDWWPWCDEALDKAKQENKPIFLSIGYSSCHWCTVMEGEAFSDLAVANYMNANYVPIKVDREERPDIDSIYMQALQLMTGQGGWPLNIFLTPADRVPFYGGTYFPLEPKYGRPSFLQVLQAIRRFYDTEIEKLQSVKDEILQRLQQPTLPKIGGELNHHLLRLGLEYSTGILATQGPGTRFPMIPYAGTALRAKRFGFTEARFDAAMVCKQRGIDLALGGIYDHVGGGFHRYTVDPTWTVPHFEKMLYDNGQIVEYLADLIAAGDPDPAFERAIVGTVQWLVREMTAAGGYFYAAQDADSFVTPEDVEPEEGAFYVWSYAELETHLTDAELAELTEQFMISPTGNFEGKIVLQRRYPGALSNTLEAALAKLFRVRYGASPEICTEFPPARTNQEARQQSWTGRIPPVTDTKMIVAWNSLMISGLTRAAVVLNRSDYLKLAVQATEFILNQQWVKGRFHRINYDGQPNVIAQAEDYALFIKALLDVQQATQVLEEASTPSLNWLDWAVRVQQEFDEFLWSIELGGYYNTDARADLIVRERSADDNATPSANGVAIANLVRLFLLTEELSYFDRAEQALQSFTHTMNELPQTCPSLFAALDWFQHPTLLRTRAEQLASLSRYYWPTMMHRLETALPLDTFGFVCQGLSCQEPARSIEQLQNQLQQSLVRF
ncbi:thioredoxin domain-containing protein [Thermocoleostomius sinensis]|uniref:Thioredoxin domain-containing protein n=1 Tax=Thermocoleostomius sinensis A174 TaxID=2016057 RepID=A0A9E8Z8M6_9CYAN|nr:thioredoxin domain-containing protein [Thermocoleostomius sinensis]WAL58525.1 thioredoxin domain-containing protein [Thermocoleostomius sinensis A174]